MVRRNEGSRRGTALVIALALAPLLVLGLVHEGYIAWSAGRDIEASGLSTDLLALAGSAADELADRCARDANDSRSALAQAMRDKLGERARWRVPADALPSRESLVASAELATRLSRGTRSLRVAEMTVHLEPVAGAHDDEPLDSVRQAVIHVRAEGEQRGRQITREVTRVQGWRVARLALPCPYDTLGLYAHDSRVIVGRAPEQAANAAEALETVREELEALGPKLPGDDARRAADAVPRIEALIDTLSDESRYSWPEASFHLRRGTPAVADLNAWMVGAVANREFERFVTAYQELHRALGEAPRRGFAVVEPALGAVLEAATRFDTETAAAARRWVKISRATPEHGARMAPGLTVLRDVEAWQARRWYDLEPGARLVDILPPDAPEAALSGVVGFPGDRVDASLVAGLRSPGRIVLVVDRAVTIAGPLSLPGGEASRFTIVATGPMTVSGEVRADLVALSGLTLAAGTRIAGNVVLAAGSLQVDGGVELVPDDGRRHGHGRPPEEVTHVAPDPFLSSRLTR